MRRNMHLECSKSMLCKLCDKRCFFRHDGYDWLVLVEDELAKIVVENVIGQLKLSDSKLIHVTPAGGWNNVLALQYDLFKHNVLGVGKNIISILDGDIKEECNSHTLYKQMPKRFFCLFHA